MIDSPERTCNIRFDPVIFSNRGVQFRMHHHLPMLISTLLTLRGVACSAIHSAVRVRMVSVEWGAVYCLLGPGCCRGLLLLLLLLLLVVVVVRAATFRATGGRSARGRSGCGGGGVREVTVAREPCEWTDREAKKRSEKNVDNIATLIPHQHSFLIRISVPKREKHCLISVVLCRSVTNSSFIRI